MSILQLQQLENSWETEIKKGNCFFQSFAFTDASTHFMEAMIIAELLMENIATASSHALRIPGMYFTACINIAHNYWGMQDVNNAADYFLYCTYKMKQLSNEPALDPLLKKAASLYWLKTVQLYTEFSQKTGMPVPVNLDKEETYLQLQKLKDLFVMNKEKMN
jgi:hypothetical protein